MCTGKIEAIRKQPVTGEHEQLYSTRYTNRKQEHSYASIERLELKPQKNERLIKWKKRPRWAKPLQQEASSCS